MTIRVKKLEGQGRMVGGDDGEGERALAGYRAG